MPRTSTSPAATAALGGAGQTGVKESQGTNQSPAARCRNLTVSAGAGCAASVTAAQINDGSFDPDGDSISFSLNPAGPFGFGSYNVELTVTDSNGASSSCSAVVTVTDNIAPTLTLNPDISLWPPDYTYYRSTSCIA